MDERYSMCECCCVFCDVNVGVIVGGGGGVVLEPCVVALCHGVSYNPKCGVTEVELRYAEELHSLLTRRKGRVRRGSDGSAC